MVSLMLSEEDNEILNHNVNYLKNLTSLMRQKFIM